MPARIIEFSAVRQASPLVAPVPRNFRMGSFGAVRVLVKVYEQDGDALPLDITGSAAVLFVRPASDRAWDGEYNRSSPLLVDTQQFAGAVYGYAADGTFAFDVQAPENGWCHQQTYEWSVSATFPDGGLELLKGSLIVDRMDERGIFEFLPPIDPPLPPLPPVPAASVGIDINVVQHGADKSGLRDSATEIQDAIDTVAAYGGGRVLFPAGSYLVSRTLLLANGVSLEGQGADHTGEFSGRAITRLILTPGANCNMFLIPLFLNVAAVRRMELYGSKEVNPVLGCGIASETYVPGPVNNSSQDTFLVIEECCFRDFRDAGVAIGPAHRAVRVSHCYAVENGGDGIQISASDCTVSHCLLGVNGGSGVRLRGAAACKVEGSDFFHNGDAHITLDNSTFFVPTGGGELPCSGNNILGNSMDRGEKEGIRLRGQHRLTRIIGNHFDGNGLAAPGTYSHVFEDGSADNTSQMIMVGNTFDDTISTTPSTAYDIFIANATRSIRVSSNLHSGRWTTGLCNRARNLRLTSGAGDSYVSGDGIARFSSVAVGDDAPLGTGLWSAEDVYLTRPNRGILSNMYFQNGWKYVQNGRGWAFVFDDASQAVVLLSAPPNTAGAQAVANPTEALRIGQDGRIIFGQGTGAGVYAGVGSPEGVKDASPGSIYLRSDGGTNTSLYVKQGGGSGVTGWVAK